MQDSVLSQVDEGSISELFDTDPLELADKDLDTIILKMREMRKDFLEKEAAAPKKAKGAGKNLKLDQLQIDLLDF